MGAVCRVDRDQHRADLRRGVLRQQPLGVVGGPDSDVLALFDAQGHEAPGHAVHFGLKLPVGVPRSGRNVNQNLALRKAIRLGVQDVPDGAVDVDGLGHDAPPDCGD